MTTKLMLTLLLAITSTQTTCDGLITGPSMFYGPDGRKHLYERTPSESKESIYCLVHNYVALDLKVYILLYQNQFLYQPQHL
mgnify:CR=1 FL=1